jgi:hypothetical protein
VRLFLEGLSAISTAGVALAGHGSTKRLLVPPPNAAEPTGRLDGWRPRCTSLVELAPAAGLPAFTYAWTTSPTLSVTKLTAVRIASSTTPGCESIGTWLLSTENTVAPMRFETKCCSSGWTVRSLLPKT